MKHCQKARIIFIFIVVVLFSWNSLSAQKDIDLPKIEIQENRLSVPFSESTRSLEIITKKEIQGYPVNSISELLQYIGGVDIRRRGPNGVQADINLRGSTFEQVLVLVNGVKVIDPQTGHHVMNLPIDLDIVERIEIVKGSAGRIYGQGGFAGAVNIVTKNPEESSAYLQAMGGQYGLIGGKVAGNLAKKKVNSYISYDYESANPSYRAYNNYEKHNIFSQTEFQLKNGEINLLISHLNNGFGANSFYAGPGDSTSFEQVNTTFATLQSKHRLGKTSLMPSIYLRNNTDLYTYKRENPDFFQNMHESVVYGATINASTIFNKNNAIGYGFDVRKESLSSNNLGERERSVLTANLEYKLYLLKDKLKLIPGVSYNYYSDFGTNFLYGIDGSYNISKRISIFGNTGTTFRIPSYTELYYSDSRNVGNPDLEPENAFTYEGGIKYISKKYFLQASYFKRDGRDIIDWTQTDVLVDSLIVQKWKPNNITELPIQGLDLSAVIHFNKISFLSPLRTVRMSYTFIDGKAIQLPNVSSRYALEHLNHQINISSHWSFVKILKFSTSYRFVNRINQPNYHLWDLGVGLNYKRFQINYTVTNVGNKEYSEFPNVPMPGAWSRLSLKFLLVK